MIRIYKPREIDTKARLIKDRGVYADYSLILRVIAHTGLQYNELKYLMENKRKFKEMYVSTPKRKIPLSIYGRNLLHELFSENTAIPSYTAVNRVFRYVGVNLKSLRLTWITWLYSAYPRFRPVILRLYGISVIPLFLERYERFVESLKEEDEKMIRSRTRGWRP